MAVLCSDSWERKRTSQFRGQASIGTEKKKKATSSPLPRTQRSRWSRCSRCLSNTSRPNRPSRSLRCASLTEIQASHGLTAAGLGNGNSSFLCFCLHDSPLWCEDGSVNPSAPSNSSWSRYALCSRDSSLRMNSPLMMSCTKTRFASPCKMIA